MGGGGDSKSEQPKLAKAQLQTSTFGQPVPVLWGTSRMPANVIWLDDFVADRIEDNQHVGKGGGGNITNVRYQYWASVMLALCEGPVASIGRVWADKDRNDTAAKAGFESTFLGTRAQSPWTQLTMAHPTKALGYGGTAMIAAAKHDLGESASLKNHTVEVVGFRGTVLHSFTDPATGLVVNAYDAHPADIISDFLLDRSYGAAWLAARLADLAIGADGTAASSFTNYCHANGLYLSLAMKEQRAGLDWLRDVLAATNSAAVYSAGAIKVLPYGDVAASGNGFTYTPANVVRYALDTSDFLDKDEPIRVARTSLADAFNICPVEYLERTQEYKPTPVESPEAADVDAFGERRADVRGLHMITKARVALFVSRCLAQRNVWIRTSYKFKLPWRYVLLEPMDLVSLTEPKLGLAARVVRITDVDEDPDGVLTVTAEEWPFGVGTPPEHVTQDGDGLGRAFNVDPGDANAPVLFVPTMDASKGALELWLATSGGADWGGAEVYVSDDGSTYSRVGTAKRARHGTLTAGITGADTNIPISLLAARGTMRALTVAARDDDVLPVWVNGEIVVYQTATLTGANAYTLGACLRGRLSSAAAAHANGDPVAVLDGAIFKYPISFTRLGRTMYVKLVSFNANGGGLQDIAAVPVYTVTLPTAPALYPTPTAVLVAAATTSPV